ncbi:MAG: nucleotidyltransferase domain-containing protein [Candidatus Bathyarchaeia archaeon]
MERIKYFEKFMEVGREIKETVLNHVKAEIYVFGSVAKGEYSTGLSDIDVAVVSDEFHERDKKLKVYDILLSKYFDSPLELHLLTKRQWESLLKLVKEDYIKI